MKKILKRILVCGLVAAVCWSAVLLSDRYQLNTGLIRFHVVANSDSQQEQAIKLQVRDAVLNSMASDLQNIANVDQAKEYLQANLPKIRLLVDQTLDHLGFAGESSVSLCKETFDVRHYDTFSLPSGVYESLRIVIGEGLGRNWWCVSFPTLCMPATTTGFQDAAVSAGFSESLAQTLCHNQKYEIRFFFLNQIGKLENILFQE